MASSGGSARFRTVQDRLRRRCGAVRDHGERRRRAFGAVSGSRDDPRGVLAPERVYPPAIVSTAKSLTWIHLSDLHFGHGKEAMTRFDQKLVTDKIIRDAELVAGELGPPDVVFLTGEIAFSASAEKEYAAAEEWLSERFGGSAAASP